jgi:GntR family transcriptional regulator / MocR family aminotransferase
LDWTPHNLQFSNVIWSTVLRPWAFKIVIRRRASTAVYLQVVHAIVDEIRSGRLTPGTALPGTRELAARLQVNRKTVVQAYDELDAQGWVTGERARGTFVSLQLPEVARVPVPRLESDAHMPAQPAFRLLTAAPDIPLQLPGPNLLTFDDGAPDTRHVPVDALARAYRHALERGARRNALGYADPRGSAELRAAISAMLNVDRGLTTTPDNICLTRGSQMAIFVSARILAGRGDTVALEELSYPPARAAFRASGAEVLALGLDAQGLKVDDLERMCRRKRVRAVYVTPHHQFPTTVLMRPERRLRLFSLAAQFGFAIVEDDYDHEFHFVHQPMLPLASADACDRVVYIGSLSKLLSPSLRLGYIAAPKAVIDRAAAEIMMIDRQGDPATEAAVAELIESGELHRHTRRVVRVYAERRALIARLLQEDFGPVIDFSLPDGGLAVWVRFAQGIDVDALARLARAEGVQLMPGSAFSVTDSRVQGARLGFASLDTAELRRAMRRLRTAFDRLADT